MYINPAIAAFSDEFHPSANQPLTQEPSIRSRWDEIRSAERNEKYRPSAWQKLREGQVSSLYGESNSSDDRRRNGGIKQTDAGRERAIAQAEFDQLLEKERRMGSE